MTWHTDCYTCTCTTSDDNHHSEFARSAPRAAAEGREAMLSLVRLPATIIDDQTWTDTERGLLSLGTCRSAPAHLGQGRVHSFAVGSVQVLLPLTQLRYLGRRLSAGGPFARRRGCVNTRLAKPIYSAEHSTHDAVQPFKRHSKNSLRYGPEPSEAGGRKIGTFIQGQN